MWKQFIRIIGFALFFGLGIHTAYGGTLGKGHEVTPEGAWCWFADPRALHHCSADGSIDHTYIGYIDVHGNIKAMQYDFKTGQQEEVLIRSCFQPDDHDNPTFLVLPDERVMVFYSRHTDEACFYYRISRLPGDLTTLGEEKRIKTNHNTTYPSPFILSDDPGHIYLCWRGIRWHPTIARLSLPDANDNVTVEDGPYQMVQSTGARPYAKYASNGKDKIYLAYTTGHPDNELPNHLYFNCIDIAKLQLEDIQGHKLASIAKAPLKVDKTEKYAARFPRTVVDSPQERDWLWQVAIDYQGRPLIAMVRISADKGSHDYYLARWEGRTWRKSFLAHAEGHFHQTPNLEKCYSAGMAIDPANTNEVYCSLPVKGRYGKRYEIVKFIMDAGGQVAATDTLTRDSRKNNVRPYIIPGSENSPLRLTWMHGDYYDWIVSERHPQGYCTGIHCDFAGFRNHTPEMELPQADRSWEFQSGKEFVLTTVLSPDSTDYQGCLLHLGELCYYLDGVTMKPEIRYKGQRYASTNILGTSDCWQEKPRGTNGRWYAPRKLDRFRLKLVYQKGVLSTYINGLLDQRIELQ